ncbi:threonine-phosphate decarboxylase CobD [Planococcus sp. N028]|uniref:threonine-phosphate decarboxylase n=1 Tax=Planococcus shixiaomingii TaxID=3058393 RepID=A0ABT8N1S5_9BACL|nr:threonine-phosphate decarboxylase CobD [Planococcus sp. N028]MDN7241826.1 threonine-phosphate decarboxylase CobD [Planococcus sp. N028]
MNLPDHGANPMRLYKQLGVEAPNEIIDFSENVHPFGPPAFIEESWLELRELISRYPDPDAEPFRSAAAAFHEVSVGHIAAGNGAAEIFTWLARRYHEKRVVLIEPAFSEYRKTLEAEGAEINAVQLKEETGWRLPVAELANAVEGCAAIYICNPHNPTGLMVSKEDLVVLADACQKADCEIVVDEAFIDFTGEENSVVPYLTRFSNLIIVRSMTKMYAIPGLRLGYVISAPPIIEALKSGAAHWNVNALSASIGARCFSEHEYRDRIIQTAKKERAQMTEFLIAHGCAVTDSEVNFLSFQLPVPKQSDKFFMDMLKNGIVLRQTKSFRGMDGRWFRIGMKSADAMKKLREEIAKWL